MNTYFETIRETRTMETLISQLPKITHSLERIAEFLEKLVGDKNGNKETEEIQGKSKE